MMKVAFQSTFPALKFGALSPTPQDFSELREAFRNRQALFIDIDTQKGGMWPSVTKKVNGAIRRVGLYFKDAETIVPNLQKLTQLHTKFKIPLLATMDSHDKNDPEFRHFTAVSDEHCRKGAEDWAKIPETTPAMIPRTVTVSPRVKDVPNVEELRKVLDKGQSVVLEKNNINGFLRRVGKTAETERFEKNRKTIQLINNFRAVGINIAVLYGVATDYCTKAFLHGLKQMGMKTIVVSDAIKGVRTDDLSHPLNEGVYDDVTVMTTQQVEELAQSALNQTA